MAGEASRENGKLGGRPMGTANLYAQEFRKALAERINKNAAEWMDAIERMALGRDGEKPDPNAWAKGMDRAFGKPEQQVDVTSNGESVNAMTPAMLALNQEYEEKMKKALLE